MTATLNFRLDERTERELAALVEHFTDADPLGRKVTASEIARIAIHDLHVRRLDQPGSVERLRQTERDDAAKRQATPRRRRRA